MTDWESASSSVAAALGEDLRAAIAEAAAAEEREYYNAEADAAAAEEYYAGTGPEQLASLVQATHTRTPRYNPSLEVYPWVDLQPDGSLRSLYTGETYQPGQLIRADFEILQARMSRLMQAIMLGEGQPTVTQSEIAAELPFNCEHVVPQSWFAGDEPMRGDLHHLFACESRCNSFRGNTPYAEFTDFPEPATPGEVRVTDAVRDDCGKSAAFGFEPAHGKGAAARAVFYFQLRYPDLITSEEMPQDRWAVLHSWHLQDAVGDWERHRNAAIFERQGNRNPFIDHPEWLSESMGRPSR